MHLTSIVFGLLFAYATYALPVSLNERTVCLSFPPYNLNLILNFQSTSIDKSITDFVVKGERGHVIAEEPGVFEVYDEYDLEFEETAAVLKVIFKPEDAAIRRELEGWAKSGYLLAYGTRKLGNTFLILKTSSYMHLSTAQTKELWEEARASAAKLKSPITYERVLLTEMVCVEFILASYHLEYDSNFSWVRDKHGFYGLELIDWNTPENPIKIMGDARRLDEIPHVNVP